MRPSTRFVIQEISENGRGELPFDRSDEEAIKVLPIYPVTGS